MTMTEKPLFEKVDCVRFYVPDLEAGLAFYRDRLGHSLIWRSEHAAGLGLPGGSAEIVIQSEDAGQEIDFKVACVEEAARRFARAGGKVIVPPFEIQIGRAVVVEDPWGSRYVLLDSSKGLLQTDDQGNIVGNIPNDEM